MEEYIPLHLERYNRLVENFSNLAAKQVRIDKAKGTFPAETVINPDVAVVARLRPLLEPELEAGFPQGVFCRPDAPGLMDAHELKRPVRGPPALPTLQSSNFQVDRSFPPESSTDDLYDDFVKPLIPWAWNGGVGTLFAYGQTGSGKTYTISHLEKMVMQSLMKRDLEGERDFYVCIFELAGNTAYDLLNNRKPFSVLEDSFGVVQLAGAVEHHVTDAAQVLAHIDTAASFRRTEKTIKNDASSRSHAICRVRIGDPTDPSREDGMLYLVDLAGSEAARDVAKHGAERMKETREINASLSVLKDCIRGKAEADVILSGASTKKKPHVPFRQSTLTKVLKHVFDPAGTASCKTVVVACVNPCLLDIGASRNTLRYAEMLRVPVPKVKAAVYDPEAPMTWSNAQLRDWITSNSGTPAIDAALLAPFESGMQLLRLPHNEFEARCLKTAGVPGEHARAFRSKLWQRHVDSQKNKKAADKSSRDANGTTAPDKTAAIRQFYLQTSTSRDPDPESVAVPFRERIRPGMVVRWNGPPALNDSVPGASVRLAIIMCPVSAVKTIPAPVLQQPEAATSPESHQFLCALVSPGLMQESFTVDLWRHIVLDVEWMEDEVVLEYDGATRYYHLAI